MNLQPYNPHDKGNKHQLPQESDGISEKDIHIGTATVKAYVKKGSHGWILPGGKFTKSHATAKEICTRMDYIIRQHGGLKRGAA